MVWVVFVQDGRGRRDDQKMITVRANTQALKVGDPRDLRTDVGPAD